MPTALDAAIALAQRRALFRRSRSVLAAVSGGPDSVALLLLLERLAPEAGFSLTAAHFDHMLRPGSKADLEWVRDLCAARGIAFLSGEGDVREAAARQGIGIEEAARRMRYQFLAFVAGERGIDAIATGHTADDQAETVLMRVLRGSGVRGIRGMQAVATVPGGSQKLIRPLLETPRDGTRAICADAGIVPREDPTNAETGPLRNRLRHDVLPVLEAINPSVRAALRRLAVNAAEVFADVERAAMASPPIERGPAGAIFELSRVRALPAEALLLVLEREAAFYRLGVEVNATRLENARQVLRRGTGRVLFGPAELEASSAKVRIGPQLEVAPFDPKVLNVPGATLAQPWRVDVSTGELPRVDGSAVCAVPFDGLKGALRIRALQPADRMRHHGTERKVAAVFANAKVPAWDRRSAVAIADGARVLAVLTASGAFEADHGEGEEALNIRLSRLPEAP